MISIKWYPLNCKEKYRGFSNLSALKRYSITLVPSEHPFKHLAIQWKFGSKFLE